MRVHSSSLIIGRSPPLEAASSPRDGSGPPESHASLNMNKNMIRTAIELVQKLGSGVQTDRAQHEVNLGLGCMVPLPAMNPALLIRVLTLRSEGVGSPKPEL